MTRVALVNVPFQSRVAAVAQTSVGPPLGLAYLAAVLERAGHEVTLLDANALGWSLATVGERLARWRPQVVGTTAATPSIDLAARFAELVQQRLGVPVVVGGAHPSALPRETLQRYPAFDVAVVGEGEGLVDPLVRALAGDGSLRDVPSIAWRDGADVRLNPPGEAPADLDALPRPARHLLPNRHYRTIDAWPMTCVIAMRGCPARCVYCNVPALAGRRMRRRSPDAVVAEIDEAQRRWGIRAVAFLDDTFTTSRGWVVQLCAAMIAAGLPRRVRWSCLTRPDCVDEPLLRMMQAAGLVRLEMGIESGSPDVLRRLDKGVALPVIREAFATARRVGLVTLGFAMINTPDETPEELAATEAELLRIDPDLLQLSFCTPYPGTPLYDDCRRRGLLTTTDWADYRFLRTPVLRNAALSPAQLRARHAAILRRFYGRPGKALRLARHGLASPDAARSLAYTSAQALRHLLWRRDG